MNTEFFGMNSSEVKLNKPAIPHHVQELDARARKITQTYLNAESEIITVLQDLDKCRGYLHFGVTSLIGYTIEILKLSEGAASNLVTVARKSVEFPALKTAIEAGEVTVSKARKIASVLTKENQNLWIDLAKTSTSRVIEKEVARVNPQAAIVEKLKYKTADRLELSFGISEELSEKLKRVKDLLAQQRSKHVNLEETLEAMVDDYLERHDPIKMAARAKRRLEKREGVVARSDSANLREEGANNAEDLREKAKSTIGDSSTERLSRSALQRVPGSVDNFSIWGGAGAEEKFNHNKRARTNLPAAVKHAVTLRDLRQCTFIYSEGRRCSSTRWLDVHHIIPVAHGGSNELKNLTTLCSAHHRLQHLI